MTVRFPAPLRPGDRIGVTSPSAGVQDKFQARFAYCVEWLRKQGYDVVVGECMDGSGIVSASARQRADELTAMLTDPTIRAVVPPWGGELGIDVVAALDYDAIAAAEPTWFVGFSDISTLLTPLTLRTGIATLHGQNLMEVPIRVPDTQLHWLDVAGAPAGATLTQGAASLRKASMFDPIDKVPDFDEWTLDQPGTWSLLDAGSGPVRVTGRLIGGCVETMAPLAGTAYGDFTAFADTHAPEGLIVYLEVCEHSATDAARELYGMRLAGWFDRATAILVGNTHAPASGDFTQLDAVRFAVGDLDVPVVLDVECGHVAPRLALVNGALATVVVDGDTKTITQTLA
ncbi:MAG: LD-carboxypeptidase [Hamadaea sp.]|nr:LD-carboxypeptidase [Hamadaea sp.]